jgi:predicted transcriptional regulator
MAATNPLDLATRRQIYNHIVQHPGQFLREIQRSLTIAMGTLEFNLAALERAGLILAVESENKRFFPAQMPPFDRRLLSVLRQAIPRGIAVVLLQSPDSTPGAMVRRLGVGPTTLNYHLARLVDQGVLERRRAGRHTLYRLVDPEPILRLLITHRESFLDRIVDGFLAGLEGLRG